MKNKPYILSVEDNSSDVILMRRVFDKTISNYDIVFFQDNDVALHFLNKKFEEADLPKLILLDIKLVKGNGLDLLKTIKKDTRFMNIPTMMLSSSFREEDVNKAYESGCNAYVEKPRSFKKLYTDLPKIIDFGVLTS